MGDMKGYDEWLESGSGSPHSASEVERAEREELLESEAYERARKFWSKACELTMFFCHGRRDNDPSLFTRINGLLAKVEDREIEPEDLPQAAVDYVREEIERLKQIEAKLR